MQALYLYREAVAKAGGAGSRGGSVVGRTKSGKPIYAHHDASHPHYRGFSAADHAQAADVHENASRAADQVGDHRTAEHHHVTARAHRMLGAAGD